VGLLALENLVAEDGKDVKPKTAASLPADERDEFLGRENELLDQITEKVH
jgi:hypothetical protein